MAYILKKQMLKSYDFFLGNMDLESKEEEIFKAAEMIDDCVFMMNDGSNHDTN
jgi:hypothetical protein